MKTNPKKYLLLITIFLFTFKNMKADEKKFEFGFSLFPNYSMVKISGGNAVHPNFNNDLESLSNGKLSLSFNLFSEYHIKKNSFIGLGLGYMNNGYRTEKTAFFAIDPMHGFISNDPNLPTHGRFVYNYHHIEIPLYYKHKFGKRFFAIVGASSTFNIANKTRSIQYYVDGSIKKDDNNDNSTNFRTFNIYGNIGFGVDYLQKENYSLFIMPYYQYGIMGVSKSTPVNRNFMSLGVSTGFRF